ncbi:oxidative stress survival, Svf1-like protein [Filobasidium floriforme]|uniref:oxidative stress survival, Svf1-like protein n=1 Tax=Filobasidium floriforme TaxID=5210 RepID=UPI001E8ED42C|nr:oxidative stress survival, Svf1-like protein [Filobasidium floriforme]KAH8086833.1 oxidative stress survival, Svf1-like protein [Filobasidium floriforme]
MSWFSSSKQSATASSGEPNFWPVSSLQTGYGELSDKDTAWACATNRGFQTETQIWYSVLADGSLLLLQVIWSFIGVWPVPAQTQMTFKLYNPTTKKSIWRSLSATGFTVDAKDGRSCKTNEYEIKHTGSASGSETYTIHAQLDKTTTLSLNLVRPADAPGFKLGKGEEGGYSRFGKNMGDDGFVIHRFHPHVQSSGQIMIDGKVIDAKGEAMFVAAIQGLRPDAVASRWNFAFFTTTQASEDEKLGSVRAIQMEFETPDNYGAKGPKSGRVKSNIGCIYSSKIGQPLVVCSQTGPDDAATVYGVTRPEPVSSGDICRATHTSTAKDPETGYDGPTGLKFEWVGKQIGQPGKQVKASLEVATSMDVGKGGLIEKVNVLNEIPYLVRKALSSITGTKPYIFQFHNEATLNVTTGDEESIPVKGWLFNEATFVSP